MSTETIRPKRKVAMFGTARAAISNTFSMVSTVVEGSANSLEDLAVIANHHTADMVKEAEFNRKKNATILEAKSSALDTVLADKEFKADMATKAKQSILEDLEF